MLSAVSAQGTKEDRLTIEEYTILQYFEQGHTDLQQGIFRPCIPTGEIRVTVSNRFLSYYRYVVRMTIRFSLASLKRLLHFLKVLSCVTFQLAKTYLVFDAVRYIHSDGL